MNDKVKGYICAVIAAASYGMIPVFTLPLYNGGMDTFSVLFFRYLVAVPILALMMFARGRSFRVNSRELVNLLLVGTLMVISSISLFMSYRYMNVGIASTLLFIYPIFVALIMFMLYKEKISKGTVACMGLALVGIALLYQGGDGASLDSTGIFFVIVSAIAYAAYVVGVNQGSLKNMPPLQLTFYILVFSLVFFGLSVWIRGSVTTPSTWIQWSNIFALALIPTAISFLCTTKAVKYIGATPTSILGALEPVTAIIFSVVLFDEVMTVREYIGVEIILVAVTFVVASDTINKLMTNVRKMFPKVKKRG